MEKRSVQVARELADQRIDGEPAGRDLDSFIEAPRFTIRVRRAVAATCRARSRWSAAVRKLQNRVADR